MLIKDYLLILMAIRIYNMLGRSESMLINSIKMQMSEMLRKKTVVFTYFVLLIFVMANFISNMLSYKDVQYVSQMFDPIKMLTLSDWSVSGYFMMEYYPLLVVIPTSCAFLTERGTGVRVYIQSKTGNISYWFGKLISVFLTTLLVFTVPFLIEIALSVICFSMSSNGDPTNMPYYQTIESESQFFLSKILLSSRVLYAITMTMLFGIISGILAVFNFSLTSLRFFKFKIFTFFPIYILFYLIETIEKFKMPEYTLNYFFILRMFNLSPKNNLLYAMFLMCLLLFSIILIGRKAKKDDTL